MFDVDFITKKYLDIKGQLIQLGYSYEIDWQEEICFERLSETMLLKEMAWVIISSGLSERVVIKRWNKISNCFHNWNNAKDIYCSVSNCKKEALKVFNHNGKISAICEISTLIYKLGYSNFKNKIQKEGISFISSLPFMGPATSYHFAKNIGLNVVKPDRHLVRIAEKFGYESPKELCERISEFIDEKISVIDLVFWRFATVNKNYLEFLILNK